MPATLPGLSFLYTAGLWALAAVAIPVLIHLFNRSRGRLVKIGHIDLIRSARKLKVTELKLADWILLFLRICIFTLAALILAGLALPGLSSNDKATAYVSPAWLNNASPQAISALLQQHSDQQSSKLLLLTKNFPVLNQAMVDQLKQQRTEAAETSDQVSNIWPLLAERLSLEDHQKTVDVYAVDSLEQFGASRPALPRQVNWNLLPNNMAGDRNAAAITVVVGYDAARNTDAGAITAALKSLQATRLPALSWQLITTDSLETEQLDVDWLILLSESAAEIESNISVSNSARAPSVRLTDAGGTSRTLPNNELQLPFYPFSEFRVSRVGEPAGYPHTLLRTPDGQPLLQQSYNGPTREISFNSRFNAAWSSIAQQPEFPEILLQWMLNDKQQSDIFPAATVLAAQLDHMVGAGDIGTALPKRSLQSLLAALMVMLWLCERWLSERQRRAQH